jgi:hypothetical protein
MGGDLRKIVAICEQYCCSDQRTMMPILLRISRSRPMEDNIIDDWVMMQAIGQFRRESNREALGDTSMGPIGELDEGLLRRKVCTRAVQASSIAPHPAITSFAYCRALESFPMLPRPTHDRSRPRQPRLLLWAEKAAVGRPSHSGHRLFSGLRRIKIQPLPLTVR